MTAPHAREWYALDPDRRWVEQLTKAIKRFGAAHPDCKSWRPTVLGFSGSEPWLCIDGWLTPLDDQGPKPTDADIPMGFV